MEKSIEIKADIFINNATKYKDIGNLEGALINYSLAMNNYQLLQNNTHGEKKYDYINQLKECLKWVIPLQQELNNSKTPQEIKDKQNTEKSECSSNAAPKKQKINKDITFSALIGFEHMIKTVKGAIVKPLLNPERFPKMSPGMLLYGPPGTGKTMFAKAICGELISAFGKEDNIDITFYTPTGAELKGKYVGETEKNIAKYYETAKSCMQESCKKNPNKKVISLIFIDECEAIMTDRGSGGDSNAVNTLLQMMDGVNSNPNIITIGATNEPWKLDDAILRRFTTKQLLNVLGGNDIDKIQETVHNNVIRTIKFEIGRNYYDNIKIGLYIASNPNNWQCKIINSLKPKNEMENWTNTPPNTVFYEKMFSIQDKNNIHLSNIVENLKNNNNRFLIEKLNLCSSADLSVAVNNMIKTSQGNLDESRPTSKLNTKYFLSDISSTYTDAINYIKVYSNSLMSSIEINIHDIINDYDRHNWGILYYDNLENTIYQTNKKFTFKLWSNKVLSSLTPNFCWKDAEFLPKSFINSNEIDMTAVEIVNLLRDNQYLIHSISGCFDVKKAKQLIIGFQPHFDPIFNNDDLKIRMKNSKNPNNWVYYEKCYIEFIKRNPDMCSFIDEPILSFYNDEPIFNSVFNNLGKIGTRVLDDPTYNSSINSSNRQDPTIISNNILKILLSWLITCKIILLKGDHTKRWSAFIERTKSLFCSLNKNISKYNGNNIILKSIQNFVTKFTLSLTEEIPTNMNNLGNEIVDKLKTHIPILYNIFEKIIYFTEIFRSKTLCSIADGNKNDIVVNHEKQGTFSWFVNEGNLVKCNDLAGSWVNQDYMGDSKIIEFMKNIIELNKEFSNNISSSPQDQGIKNNSYIVNIIPTNQYYVFKKDIGNKYYRILNNELIKTYTNLATDSDNLYDYLSIHKTKISPYGKRSFSFRPNTAMRAGDQYKAGSLFSISQLFKKNNQEKNRNETSIEIISTQEETGIIYKVHETKENSDNSLKLNLEFTNEDFKSILDVKPIIGINKVKEFLMYDKDSSRFTELFRQYKKIDLELFSNKIKL